MTTFAIRLISTLGAHVMYTYCIMYKAMINILFYAVFHTIKLK